MLLEQSKGKGKKGMKDGEKLDKQVRGAEERGRTAGLPFVQHVWCRAPGRSPCTAPSPCQLASSHWPPCQSFKWRSHTLRHLPG
jgi:hypothetical protein